VLLKKWFISGVVSRTELGKPYIKNDNMTTFSISHHSDTTVLSLINSKKYVVGVDVVDLAYRSCVNGGNEAFGEFVECFKNVVGEEEREWCCDTTR
jgi:phosphopantetheinyl transferase